MELLAARLTNILLLAFQRASALPVETALGDSGLSCVQVRHISLKEQWNLKTLFWLTP